MIYLELPPITLTDIAIFIVGIVAGTVLGYVIGKFVFSRLFVREEDSITLENTAKYTAIQQGLNYILGFALGTAFISTQLALILLLVWLAVQTFLAVKIFNFDRPIHGFTYALIDTGIDLGVGAAFGTGAATLTLIQLML